FFNKTLDSSERNYDATEREGLACLKAVEHWEHLLLGRPFTVRMDHEALKGIYGGTGKNRRQTFKFIRWKERLGAYDFKIHTRTTEPVADYISCLQAKTTQLDVELKPASPTVAAITLADLFGWSFFSG
ncbi:MAG: hypothetical protein GY696_31395, partial [Gammaproteobacteria bacterium]|nr:hypothetical protein [Gammaproteobacteria bacterium]